MGGNDGANWVENVEIFSPRRGTWVQGTPMPSARCAAGSARLVMQGSVRTQETLGPIPSKLEVSEAMLGSFGSGGSGPDHTREGRSQPSCAWLPATGLFCVCRGYGAAAAIGQHVYLVGGGNGSSWLKGAMVCKLDEGSAWSEVT